MGNVHSRPTAEVCSGLCRICAAGYTKIEPYLKGQEPDNSYTYMGTLRSWDLRVGDLRKRFKKDCSLCSLISKQTHDSCVEASHDYVLLAVLKIPQDQFARPPVAPTIYLEFEWSCGARYWYFPEDDQKDHLKGTIGFAHQVAPKLDETDWHLIRHWVYGCLQRHQSDCISPDQIDLPGFEVIDCKTRKLVPGNKGAEFAALSYVWGSQTQDILPNRTILPTPFPEKVIEDALACTHQLKIPYLWVDRYCIDQNDTSGTKQHLIQSMDKIYSAAKVTIISVAGVDASAGLPGVSTALRTPSPSSAVIYGRKFVPVLNPRNSIYMSKWATRGWTLQESLLARRRLVFADTQVYFQCTQTHCIESVLGAFHSEVDFTAPSWPFRTISGPRSETQAFPSSVIGSHLSSYSTANVCNEFAKRDLTTDEDTLRACLGIFSRLWASDKPGYQYCGLPFEENSDTAFAASLLWTFKKFHSSPFHSPPRRRTWGPSWSWVTWRASLNLNRLRWDINPENFKLYVDIKIPVKRGKPEIMSTINDYIKDIGGGGLYQHWLPYLKLSGWIATMRFKLNFTGFLEHSNGAVSCHAALGQEKVGQGQILPPMWAEISSNDQAANSSRLLSVIFVIYEASSGMHCLVIRRVGEDNANKYERLGSCEVRCVSPEIKGLSGMHYMTVTESRTGIARDLDYQFETITLV